ncbi:MAG: phage holin family protein [Actinobacteria bacterium]|nr:phage holin family protein [Actinomycetota bacterium]
MAQSDKSLPTLAGELWELVVAYAKQETVDPLKRLGRFLGYGVPGAVLTGLGLVLLSLAGLRALQTETGDTFDGSWSWAPYGILLIASSLVALLAARAIGANKRRARKKGRVG